MAEHFISRDDAERDLLACAAYLAEYIRSSDGRATAMKAVVPRYLEKHNVDLAAELSNTVDDPFVRDRLLTTVAETCASIDDDEYALQLVDAIEDPGVQMQARERVALQLAAQGDLEKARNAAETLSHRDNVLAGIAVKQHGDGSFAEALATAGEIGFSASSAHAYVAMAAESLEKGDTVRAGELLDLALVRAGEIEHEEERIRSLIDVGNSFAAAGRNDRAIETFDMARGHAEVLDNVHRDNFLASISVGFMRTGSVELADRTLDAVQDKTQIATALLGFAREYWQRGEKEESLDALEEAYAVLKSQHERETRSTKDKYALFTNIAVQFAGFEKGDRALEIAHEISDDEYATNALSQITRIMTLQKKDELMRQALASITDDGTRVFTLIGMSETARESGEPEKAAEFLNEAFALAEEVPQIASRSSAYNTLARRYLDNGEADLARSAASESLNAIAEIKDESTIAVSLVGLSEIFEAGKYELTPEESERIRQILLRVVI